MGPGLISGASDDDPSGIATHSQVGAQFGYGLGWTLIFSYPLMCAIQQIAAEIGRVTGEGLAGNLRRHFPKWMLYSLVASLVVANTINIGADIGDIAAALKLLIDAPTLLYIASFAMLSVAGRFAFTVFALGIIGTGHNWDVCSMGWVALRHLAPRGARSRVRRCCAATAI